METAFQGAIRRLAQRRRVEWKKHALKRLFERGLTRQAVFRVAEKCEIIEAYVQDKPLPSFLLLGSDGEEPLHVVAALDEENDLLWIITVYRPDPEEWEEGFRIRRSR